MSNSKIDDLMEMLDVNKISSAHDLYSGKPAPYAEGYRNGFNMAKSMLKQAIQQIIEDRMIEFQSSLEEDYEQELLKVRIDELLRFDEDNQEYRLLRLAELRDLQAKLKDTTMESE